MKPFIVKLLNTGIKKFLQKKQVVTENSLAEGCGLAENLTDDDQEWILTIGEIAKNALGKDFLSVDYIANELGISSRTFQRKLKATIGLTPKAFLAEVQMQYARQLLEGKSVKSIRALAHQLGFANAHYFSKKYEERFGKSPQSYLE